MEIDWLTFAAQIINFLILVALLKHFLYKRIINTMDNREAHIAERLNQADRKRKDAETTEETYRQMLETLDEERETRLNEAQKEVEAQRKAMLAQVRADVDQARSSWYAALQRERQAFLQDLEQRTGHQTCQIARRALADLANTSLEQQAVDVFIERLRHLDPEERLALTASIRVAHPEIVIRSTFEICPESQQRINDVIQKQLDQPVRLNFETTTELGFGIELTTPGRKITWSLNGYMDSLEETLAEMLRTNGKGC